MNSRIQTDKSSGSCFFKAVSKINPYHSKLSFLVVAGGTGLARCDEYSCISWTKATGIGLFAGFAVDASIRAFWLLRLFMKEEKQQDITSLLERDVEQYLKKSENSIVSTHHKNKWILILKNIICLMVAFVTLVVFLLGSYSIGRGIYEDGIDSLSTAHFGDLMYVLAIAGFVGKLAELPLRFGKYTISKVKKD